jgi:hypothetical protein
MSNPSTSHRDALKKMEPLNSAKSEGYGKFASHQTNQASPFNFGEFSVGELYGCICHRPTDEISISQISSDYNPWLRGFRAPSEAKSDHVGRLDR